MISLPQTVFRREGGEIFLTSLRLVVNPDSPVDVSRLQPLPLSIFTVCQKSCPPTLQTAVRHEAGRAADQP
jgi:hypothetical protein